MRRLSLRFAGKWGRREHCDSADIARLREQLRTVPIEDRATWAQVARDTAGAFAAWPQPTEATPGPLAETSRTLARSGQLQARDAEPRPPQLRFITGAAMLAGAVATPKKSTVAQTLLMRELTRLARSLHRRIVGVILSTKNGVRSGNSPVSRDGRR